MPSRKIPRSYRSITGLRPSEKVGRMVRSESTLERDFLILCEFDVNVAHYEEQPVRIDYTDEHGRPRHYTPDVLVTYRSDIIPGQWMPPLLCEIKYREDLKKDWITLRPKFRAARAYARAQGWKFKVLTERKIRTPFLNNARFLLPFRFRPRNDAFEELLLSRMRDLRECDPEMLLAACFRDPEMQARLIPSLWQLIAAQRIWCDLDVPLTMKSRVWMVDPELPGFDR